MKKFIFVMLIAISTTMASDVNNEIQPKGKAMTLAFEEELRIDPTNAEDDIIWTGARSIVQVNEKGHMFVLDHGGKRILEFDPKGNFVRQISGPGEGPGEVDRPANFNILANNTAILTENKGFFPVFNYFDKDMKFVERKAIKDKGMVLNSAQFSSTGNHIAAFGMTLDQAAVATVGGVFLTKDLDVVTRFPSSKIAMPIPQRISEAGFWENFLADWFRLAPTQQALLVFSPNGKAFSAMNGKYEITRYDDAMKKELVFSKVHKPIVYTDEEREALVENIHDEILSTMTPQMQQFVTESRVRKAVELAEFPPAKPPLHGLVPMDNGGLLAISDYSVVSRRSKGDIFDEKGNYLGSLTLPPVSVNVFAAYFGVGPRMIFQNGKAYIIEEDENEEMNLVRYSYKLVPAK